MYISIIDNSFFSFFRYLYFIVCRYYNNFNINIFVSITMINIILVFRVYESDVCRVGVVSRRLLYDIIIKLSISIYVRIYRLAYRLKNLVRSRG